MFRTPKCSSSQDLYMMIYGIYFMHAYKQSGRWQNVLDVKHVEDTIIKLKL
jgi:hypothetical protein